MNVVLKSALVAILLSASVANAGGPVLIEEGNNELIEEKSVNSAGILPVLGLLVLACLIACGGKGGAATPPVVPPK